MKDSGVLAIGQSTCGRLDHGETATTLLFETGLMDTFNDSFALGIVIGAAVRNLCPGRVPALEAALEVYGFPKE